MSKVILITGANRGIGLGIAKGLAAMSHTVLMGSRDSTVGEEAAKSIQGDAISIKLDVTSNDDIERVQSRIKEEFGSLDVLINNAGVISSSEAIVEIPVDDAKRLFDTNFFGVWRLTRALIPLLQKSKDGSIINVSSGMGAFSDLTTGYAPYRLSKYVLNGFTRMLSNELKGRVKVNAMCPGWVRTDMGGPSANRSVQQGADTAIWLATASEIPTGLFFRDRKEIPW